MIEQTMTHADMVRIAGVIVLGLLAIGAEYQWVKWMDRKRDRAALDRHAAGHRRDKGYVSLKQ